MGREALQIPREAPPRTPCAPLPNYKLAHRLITAACRSLPPRKFGSYTPADIRPRFPNPDNYTLSTGQPSSQPRSLPSELYLFLPCCVLLFFFSPSQLSKRLMKYRQKYRLNSTCFPWCQKVPISSMLWVVDCLVTVCLEEDCCGIHLVHNL